MQGEAYVEAVLRKAETLRKTGFWPQSPYLRAQAWVNNFEDDEKEIAAAILDSFVYFPEAHTNALLRAGYSDLTDFDGSVGHGGTMALEHAYFTRVEGEDPNPSDSGNVFCRKARNLLGIPESQLVEPQAALDAAVSDGRAVVFLDDFVGSGNQMCSTWTRPYRGASPVTFEAAQATSHLRAFYLVLVSTRQGLDSIQQRCPGLAVRATHVLGDEYSVRRMAELPHVPKIPNLADRVHRMLDKYAPQLELPDFMQNSDFSSYGFHSLGLMLGFQHGCPDATLPLVWAPGPLGWTPLVSPS